AIYRTEVCTEVCAGAIYPNKVVSEPGYDKQWQKTDRYRGGGYDRGQEAEQKQIKIMEDRRDKPEPLMTHWLCCVENTVEDRNMDSGASFHATYCKEELERFKLPPDVRYIPGLKRRLISVGQLDEEGYHWQCSSVTQRLGDMSKNVMKHVSSKGKHVQMYVGSRYYDTVIEDCSKSCGRYNANLQVKCLKFDNGGEYSIDKPIKFVSRTRMVMLKIVPETPLQFGVAERLSRTFRAESTEICVEAPKMLWADSVSTTYLIYGIPYVSIGLRIPEEEWRGKDTSRTLEVAQMKCRYSFRDMKSHRLSEAEISHLWTQFMEPKIIQSPGGSSDMSEGSENSGSFKDSGRSDKEYSEDGASSKEGGFETPQFSMGHAHGLCSLARAVQFSTGRAVGMIVQFSTDRAVGTIVQFGTSLSSLAQNLIISLWFDLVDCPTILVVDTTSYIPYRGLYRGVCRVCPIVNAPAGRLLGAYDLGIATLRALVHAGDKTNGDVRSWYMISGDAKLWVKRMIVKVEMYDSRL
ncbi:retrovirus-related pol polyprotein from transposon TNT 1-94, partial [Tanacetum coccineum]